MESDDRRRKTGFFLGLVASGTYGLIPLFSLPVISAGVTVETILAYRFTMATIMMWPLLAFRGERFAIRGIDAVKLFGLSGFYMFTVWVFFHAFSYIASGLAATIQFLYPVMVMLIMIGFFHERFYWHIAIAIILAIAGVALLTFSPDLDPALEPGAKPPTFFGLPAIFIGVVLSLLAGLGNSLYYVGIQVAKIPNISSIAMTFYVMFFGAIICFLNAMLSGNLQMVTAPRELFTIFLLALVTAVISNLALIMAIERVGSTLCAVLGVLEPLTAVIVGTLVFGEPFTLWIVGGIILILGSVLLVILWPKEEGKRQG